MISDNELVYMYMKGFGSPVFWLVSWRYLLRKVEKAFRDGLEMAKERDGKGGSDDQHGD